MTIDSDDRLGQLEQDSAAQSRDITGLYAGLEEIRDVLIRMQESAKPNLNALFLVLLATCTFIVTIGGLTLAPIYREQARAYEALTRLQEAQGEVASTRFTREDGEKLELRLRDALDRRINNHTHGEVQ